MIQKVFSVYDSKAEAFLPPFFCGTRGIAVRVFAQAANEAGHNFSKWPGDYTLFELGEFDDREGKFFVGGAAENLGTALQYVEGKEERLPLLESVDVDR